VQKNADGIIVSGARLSLFRDRLEGRAGLPDGCCFHSLMQHAAPKIPIATAI
jgi:hypothetical protein